MPEAAKIIILGGGIHGAGVLHDLCSRGFSDVTLIEKNELGSGTSSKSTKLIHGGLRYLEHPSQIGMVYESLRERKLLLNLASDIVHPMEFLIPIEQGSNFESIKMKLGLGLYDLLATKSLIEPYKVVSTEEARRKIPILKKNLQIKKIYSYWDAQTDDKELVKKVALSAKKLGGKILEKTEVISLKDQEDSWQISYSENGLYKKDINAKYIINCLGPWSNFFLEKNGFTPSHKGKNNKGTHIILKDFGLKSSLLLKALDKRIFFVIPWKRKTLIGTTEKAFDKNPSSVKPSQDEIDYLIQSTNKALDLSLKISDIEESFSGLRWLASDEGKTLTKTSRESILGEIKNKSGFILTLYGGKLTSYRSLSEKVGDAICKHLNITEKTKTHLKESWF